MTYLAEIEPGVMKRLLTISIEAGLMQGFFLTRSGIDENKRL